MRKGIISILCLILCLSLYAQSQSIEEGKAEIFFQLNNINGYPGNDGATVDTSFVYKNLTIVNFKSPKGFVIVRSITGGDEIVGYSYSNNFSFDADSSGALAIWADGLVSATAVAGYHPETVISRLKTGRLPVEPLCQTKWNQGWPYNYYCPVDPVEDRTTLVGCVAVAVGQIIRYYDKWNNFSIQYSYAHEEYGTLSCNAGTYNWSAMENSCRGINHEVARLLYHSGVLVNMNYGLDGSGASSDNAAGLFNRIYVGGNLNHDPYGNQEQFYNSISQYKPIYSTYEGHAFVCDGYDGNNMYHFNLGWGGSANGFYILGNVVGHSLLSAIFNTAPNDSLKPPQYLQKSQISDSELEVSWHGPAGNRDGLTGYSVYLDDVYYEETSDTVYVHNCIPGSHYIRIAANYTTGESRWIGPASYFSHGNPITIPDDKLRIAMNASIGIPSSQRPTHDPSEGELHDIWSLNVTNADDLTGISYCTNLKNLNLNANQTGKEIDVSELENCSTILQLKLSKYKPVNTAGISALVNVQDIKLYENTLTDLDFLSSLKDMDKLEVKENELESISFLNDLDKLTWILMENCRISSFDEVENTFGIKYFFLSDNQISNLEWINDNRTLRTLDVGNNQLSGEINLSGLLQLRTLVLDGNQIKNIDFSDTPLVETINVSNNQVEDMEGIIEQNENLSDLDISWNMVGKLPSVNNKLTDLDMQNNLVYDLTPLDHYGSLEDLDLRDNRVTDLSPLVFKSYAGKLTRLNMRGNPISKESYMDYRTEISQLAGSAMFPSSYYKGSPCYLEPCKDSVMMDKIVKLSWEGDYDEEGYLYDVFLAHEEEEYSRIAEGLSTRSFETTVDDSGNYSWYVVAKLEEDSLYSGYANFKIFSGFNLPFLEDFEIYTSNVRLCIQSPYWRVYGEDPADSKDAFVTDIRSYEGDNSIKIAGATDLVFPVSEYLTAVNL